MSGQISFECEHCGAKLKAASDRIGRVFACPKCGVNVEVPGEGLPELPPLIPSTEGEAFEQKPEAARQVPSIFGNPNAVRPPFSGLGTIGALTIFVGLLGVIPFLFMTMHAFSETNSEDSTQSAVIAGIWFGQIVSACIIGQVLRAIAFLCEQVSRQ